MGGSIWGTILLHIKLASPPAISQVISEMVCQLSINKTIDWEFAYTRDNNTD